MPEATWPQAITLPPTQPYLLVSDEHLRCLEQRNEPGVLAEDPALRFLVEQTQDLGTEPLYYGPHGLNHALLTLSEDKLTEKHAQRAWTYVEPFLKAGTPCLYSSTLWAEQAGSIRDAYNTRSVLPYVALIYHWAGDVLSREQRDELRNFLWLGAEFVWPETNPQRVGAWSIDNPHDNFYWGHLYGTTLAALALWFTPYFKEPEAERERTRKLLEVVQRRWLDQALHWLESHSGYLLEGTNYGYETWGRILTCLRVLSACDETKASEDLLPGRAAKVYATLAPQVMETLAHLTTPDLGSVVPFGGQTRLPFEAPISDYTLHTARQCYEAAPLLVRAWMQAVEPHLQSEQVNWRSLAWQRYLTDCGALPAKPLAEATGGRISHFDSRTGLFAARSAWDGRGSQVVALCPDTLHSTHQDRAIGQVHFHAGGQWLLAFGRCYQARQESRESLHNNVLVFRDYLKPPSEGNPWQQAEMDEDLDRVLTTNGLQRSVAPCVSKPGIEQAVVHLKMFLPNAYAKRQWDDQLNRPGYVTPNEDWVRRVHYVPALDLLVVADRVTSRVDSQGRRLLDANLPLTLPKGGLIGGLYTTEAVNDGLRGVVTWAKEASITAVTKSHRRPDELTSPGAALTPLREVEGDPQSQVRGNRLTLWDRLRVAGEPNQTFFWFAATAEPVESLSKGILGTTNSGPASYWSEHDPSTGIVRSKIKDTLIADFTYATEQTRAFSSWVDLGPKRVAMGNLLVLGLKPGQRYEFKNLAQSAMFPPAKGDPGLVLTADEAGAILLLEADKQRPGRIKPPKDPRKSRAWWLRKVPSNAGAAPGGSGQ